MQQTELVSGFSELKDLLIRTYQIDKPREKVRLYFSEFENQLLMHDYHDHKKIILLSTKITSKHIEPLNKHYAIKLVTYALNEKHPVSFLNKEFKLNGFFIS